MSGTETGIRKEHPQRLDQIRWEVNHDMEVKLPQWGQEIALQTSGVILYLGRKRGIFGLVILLDRSISKY